MTLFGMPISEIGVILEIVGFLFLLAEIRNWFDTKNEEERTKLAEPDDPDESGMPKKT